MRVGTVMRQPVVVVAPDDVLVDAAAWMTGAAIDVAPVCVDGRLVGLLVGRDVVARARAAGCDPTTATVRDLMTTDPIHGQAEHDLVAADRLMRQRKIGQLAILDDDKRLVGVERASGRVRTEVVTMTAAVAPCTIFMPPSPAQRMPACSGAVEAVPRMLSRTQMLIGPGVEDGSNHSRLATPRIIVRIILPRSFHGGSRWHR